MAAEDYVTICSNPNCNMQYLYAPNRNDKKDMCGKCGSSLLHTTITAEEMFLIERVSKDKDFIKAMIQLKDDNIIEYKSRIAQWREDARKAGVYGKDEQQKYNSYSDIHHKCPTCGSTNIEKISTGKKISGGFLFGIFSSDVRNTMHCKDCGSKW